MKKWLPMTMVLILLSHEAKISLAESAVERIKAFLQADDSALGLEGQFINTPPEYGTRCELLWDFTPKAENYLTVRGEYAPRNGLGDGIFFADPGIEVIEVKDHSLVIEQTIDDDFSSGLRTRLMIKKTERNLWVDITTMRSMWWLTDSVDKHCVVVAP